MAEEKATNGAAEPGMPSELWIEVGANLLHQGYFASVCNLSATGKEFRSALVECHRKYAVYPFALDSSTFETDLERYCKRDGTSCIE